MCYYWRNIYRYRQVRYQEDRMSKNIVILSDGTAQEGGKGHDSNVYKLYRMLEDRTDHQIVFYDEGLGTDWRKISGNAFGVGFSENLLECYRFIFDNYNAGDRLFLFGFSRGAATVRSLASFIHYFGILPKARPELIKQAYRLYKNRRPPKSQAEGKVLEQDARRFMRRVADRGRQFVNDASYQIYAAWRKDIDDASKKFTHAHPNQWVSIEFLGVWDTVPALGFVPLAGFDLILDRLPWWKHSYHDFKLHQSVKNAYHALSIDDDRRWFFPTIWNEYHDETKQKIRQVWFSGAHTDVGGGFAEAGLSDITLEWMVQKALLHGLRIYLGSRKYWNFCIAPDATDKYHPPRRGWGRIFWPGTRDKIWDKKAFDSFGPPVIHDTVLERARRDPNYRPWILKNYPDPEKWLQESLKRKLLGRFNEEIRSLYQEWYMEKWLSGDHNPPAFEAWLAKNPQSFKKWLKKNRLDARRWLAERGLAIAAFEGKKYLVERSKKSGFRDYDENTLEKKLEQIYADPQENDNLWERAMTDGRLLRDRNRWAEAKKAKKGRRA